MNAWPQSWILPMQLRQYLDNFRNSIEKFEVFGLSEKTEIKEEIRPGKQAVINIHVSLINETNLYLRAYIDARYKINLISYAFQYQKKDGQLIFRYDNAAHKPKLSSKDHKHLSDGDIVETDMPDIAKLVDEIIDNF